MNTDYTDITIVLDRSGSMSSIVKETIGGFNRFLQEQKSANVGKATISLVQFDDQYEVNYTGVDIASANPLNESTYIPRGMTALLDACGKTINATGARLAAMPEEARPGKVLFLIITDGEENSSHEYTNVKIKSMITEQQIKYNWQFVFLGANQDSFAVGHSIGVSRGMAANYVATPTGTLEAWNKVSVNAVSYRGRGISSSNEGDENYVAFWQERPDTNNV